MNVQRLALILILLLAFFVRFWQLDKAPSSLYWDEMDVGYQAYSFLKTGKDYFGNYFPIYFHSFADFRTPLFIYATVPFVAIFGLNEYAVRLPAVVFGVLSVFLFNILLKELIGSKKWIFLPTLFFAVSPWQIQYSRISFELSLMIFLFLLGLLGFLKGLKNPRWFYISALGFGLSVWTYSIAKLFIPLFAFALIVINLANLKKIDRKVIISSLILFTFILIPVLFSNFFGGGGQRFSEISILTDPTISSEINNKRLEQSLSSGAKYEAGLETTFLEKLTFNKVLYQLDKFSTNYLLAFSPEFLFLEGDLNLRHSPPGIGQLYRIDLLLLILGAVFLILNYKKTPKEILLMILVWIILAPIPSALTRDGGNHASRLFFLSPVLLVVMSFGAYFLVNNFASRLTKFAIAFFSLIFITQFFIFQINYFTLYKWTSAEPFQYGYKQASQKAEELKGDYDIVIMDDDNTTPLMAYLFSTKYDPSQFQGMIRNLDAKLFNEIDARKIDNVYFTNPLSRDWLSLIRKNDLKDRTLLIVSAKQMKQQDPNKLSGELGKNGKLIDVIYYPNKLPAFYVMEVN